MTDPRSRIPKVIIGNPETAGIAFDFIPNYCPYFVPNVSARNQHIYYGDTLLHLSDQDEFLLSQCDGTHSVYALTNDLARAFPTADFEDAAVQTFNRLKWARSLGL